MATDKSTEEEQRADGDGLLVELDGLPNDILTFLSNELSNGTVGVDGEPGWVSKGDVATSCASSVSSVDNVIAFINQYTCSAEIVEDGDMVKAVFRTLTGSIVPLEGKFEEIREKEVEVVREVEVIREVPVETIVLVPEPVEVGSSLRTKQAKPPVKGTSKSKTPARRPTRKAPKREGNVIWATPPIPPRSLGRFFNEPDYYPLFKVAVENGRHVALSGPPGTGKSTTVEEYAVQTDTILVNISADAGLSRRVLEGYAEIDQGTSTFNASEYVTACVHGWWVKIDEVNGADADALMFLNSQMSPPYCVNFHGQSRPIHPSYRLFVTYNRGLVGTKLLPQNFHDRFTEFPVGYPDDMQLKRLLIQNGLGDEENLRRFINVARAIWESEGGLRFQLSPRRLFDGILFLNEGIAPDVALTSAILPYVFIPQEVDVVARLIKDGLSSSKALGGDYTGMEVRR